MLVKKIEERHASRLALRWSGGRSLGRQASNPEEGCAGLRGSLLTIELSPVLGNVGIHLGPMTLTEIDHPLDQVCLERGKLLKDLVHGTPALMTVDDRVQTDPMSRQDDLAVGPLGQEFGKFHGRSPRFANQSTDSQRGRAGLISSIERVDLGLTIG